MHAHSMRNQILHRDQTGYKENLHGQSRMSTCSLFAVANLVLKSYASHTNTKMLVGILKFVTFSINLLSMICNNIVEYNSDDYILYSTSYTLSYNVTQMFR